MENKINIGLGLGSIKSHKVGSVVVLETKADAFQIFNNITDTIKLFEWFDYVSNDKTIMGILYLGDECCFGEDAHAGNLKSLTGENINPKEPHLIKKIVDYEKRETQITILNNFIRKIIEFPKMFFISLTNSVVSPFWGLSLAADYRIANPNLIVHLNSKAYGLHPTGGVPFFLQKQVGLSKTQEMLYNEKFLDAKTAKNLGLINQLTSVENYRSDAISITNNILESTNYEYFCYTKKLVNHRLLSEFENYCDLEAKMLLH